MKKREIGQCKTVRSGGNWQELAHHKVIQMLTFIKEWVGKTNKKTPTGQEIWDDDDDDG